MEAWYLPAEEYYASPDAADDYPVRQGDVFGPVNLGGREWSACQLLNPTCEIAKRSVPGLQVIRVRPLSDVQEPGQQALVCTGWQEKGGVLQVAVAHTFFLAPIPALGIDGPLFADFRDLATVDKQTLLGMGRAAVLTHETRVTFIRRLLYYLFRLNLSYSAVLNLERERIASDSAFEGPRPTWAPAMTDAEVQE